MAKNRRRNLSPPILNVGKNRLPFGTNSLCGETGLRVIAPSKAGGVPNCEKSEVSGREYAERLKACNLMLKNLVQKWQDAPAMGPLSETEKIELTELREAIDLTLAKARRQKDALIHVIELEKNRVKLQSTAGLDFVFFVTNCCIGMEEAEMLQEDILDRFQNKWVRDHGPSRAKKIVLFQCARVISRSWFDTVISTISRFRRAIWY